MFSGRVYADLSAFVYFIVQFGLVPYFALFWLCGAVCGCFALKTSHINLLCEVGTQKKGSRQEYPFTLSSKRCALLVVLHASVGQGASPPAACNHIY